MACWKHSLLLQAVLLSALFLALGDAEPQVPAIYVFGDSTADVGNNNYINGIDAKANYPHYGIDFPGSRPTGRFSNAYNGIDFVAVTMGYKRSPPPYFSLTSERHHHLIFKGLRGVNFASAGSGILNSTGNGIITMAKQIEYFATFRSSVEANIGAKSVNSVLSKSIFLISSGGNDVFANFQENPVANETQREQWIAVLISEYRNRLETLYKLGARKFAIIDVPMIGCVPSARILSTTADCIDALNKLALGVNNAAKILFQNLSSTLAGMKYSIGSSYAVVSNITANPAAVGFTDVKDACCGTGRLNAETLCIPEATYCAHRNQYLFWDKIHPTDATSKLAGYAFYNGSLKFAAPINFKELVMA